MASLSLKRLGIAATLSAAASAFAGAEPSGCELPEADEAPSTRVDSLRQYEQLPQQCLRAMFRECTRASQSAMLDFGSAANCSIGYEALLSKGSAATSMPCSPGGAPSATAAGRSREQSSAVGPHARAEAALRGMQGPGSALSSSCST